jgi:superfamily I DNA/RNA helicase
VVAVHRAVRLAAECSGRVLLTSFSRTLAQRLREHAGRLLPENDAAWERLEVANVHAIARRLVAESGRRFEIASAKDLDRIVADTTRRHGGRYSAGFVMGEWDAIVEPWGVDTWEAYLEAPRVGRGTPLGARQRRDVWTVCEAVLGELADRELMTWGQVTREAAALADGKAMFAHVLADECQDLGPAELAVLRALVPAGADDLFLCGDAGQQIYLRGYSWLQAGIDVRGRSRRLKVNYRTTEQIRRWADALLPAEVVQGDGEMQSRHSVSLLVGPAPEIVGAATAAEEAEMVSAWIEDRLAEGLVPGDIAIFARTHALLETRAEPALARLGRSGRPLKDDAAPSPDHVALGTMHNAKGLEFRAVAVVGCDEGALPLAAALRGLEDVADREAAERQERNLLYVACTRAQRRLLVSYAGKPSPYLPVT